MDPAWSPSHVDAETARNIWIRDPSQPQRLGLTVNAWRDIYVYRNGRQDLSKRPIHVGSVDPMPGMQTISMADHDNHARQTENSFSWILQESPMGARGNHPGFCE